ncbi:hypothetical protein [Bosea robiniae]|uniref:hypothetical protein n=1 Tax=Bosea robiniae TaxID=1036780 RepID=UPI0011138258|nr:hypothetical protein [Bosea robiniae]
MGASKVDESPIYKVDPINTFTLGDIDPLNVRHTMKVTIRRVDLALCIIGASIDGTAPRCRFFRVAFCEAGQSDKDLSN